jgi:hypothetical protein
MYHASLAARQSRARLACFIRRSIQIGMRGRSQNAERREKFRDFYDKNRSMNGHQPAFPVFLHFALTLCELIGDLPRIP